MYKCGSRFISSTLFSEASSVRQLLQLCVKVKRKETTKFETATEVDRFIGRVYYRCSPDSSPLLATNNRASFYSGVP